MTVQHNELSKLRFERAKQCLESAELLLNANDYGGSVNRSYYAIFHGMRTMLAIEGKDFAKHSAVISYFRKTYIKQGILPVEVSDIIGEAFDIRNVGDYSDLCFVSKEEAKEQIENASAFLKYIDDYFED
ncbi:MAG: HEPN domain-containing protein [Phascolarctobacterium sp.]|nr:HEPN domain-containing protein [Phascolarctobacterium sp.]